MDRGSLRLRTLSSLPEGMLDCEVRDLAQLLEGPTLINLPGKVPEPLFLSTLLHGNETTGIRSIQQVLKELDLGQLPRALSILIGNVEAASRNERRLRGQPDYNRIWSRGDTPEHSIAREVLDRMAAVNVFACIDIHNNTGRNPHYAIVATRDDAHLSLARRFGSRIVYSTFPDSSCSVAFSELCPSITIEAGKVDDASGVQHVSTFLRECILDPGPADGDIEPYDLLHTVAVVKLREDCSVGLLGQQADVELLPDVDRFNFNLLDPGTTLGRARNDECFFIEASEARDNVSEYLVVEGGHLQTAKPLIPAMLTTDCEIIKLDCLCYFMERLL